MMGLITPIFFCATGVLMRRLCDPRYGISHNGTTISMTGILLTNIIILIVALIYWSQHEFSTYLFLVGTVGAIINSVGITCVNTAIAKGPMGPVSAIVACSNILLVLVEAFKNQKVPSWIEFIALVLGFAGALELVIPQFFEKICCICCLKRKGTKE